jgi:hypothetical protein
MLSTTQALKEWDSVLKLLAEVKAHAAAHPNQQSMPINLEGQLAGSVAALSKELASPHVMWKQLLKKKVSTCTAFNGSFHRMVVFTVCWVGFASHPLVTGAT